MLLVLMVSHGSSFCTPEIICVSPLCYIAITEKSAVPTLSSSVAFRILAKVSSNTNGLHLDSSRISETGNSILYRWAHREIPNLTITPVPQHMSQTGATPHVLGRPTYSSPHSYDNAQVSTFQKRAVLDHSAETEIFNIVTVRM